MEHEYPNCPRCNRKGHIMEPNLRKCLHSSCSENLFVRNGPHKYQISCFHTKTCRLDEAGASRICVQHCDLSWSVYTFNQAEMIRMMHEAENSMHIANVCEI